MIGIIGSPELVSHAGRATVAGGMVTIDDFSQCPSPFPRRVALQPEEQGSSR